MADYAITAVERRVVYSGSAGTGPYNFNFPVLTATDIKVYQNATLKTLTTHYTVSISGSTGTGSVTLGSAASGSDTITIVGARSIQRSSDFVTAGDLLASSLNTELDSLTIFVQQVSEESDRAIKAPVTDPTDIDMALPAKADRLGKYLAFDGTSGDPIIGETVGANLGNWAAATVYSLRDLVKDTSNNNIYIALEGHTSSGSQPISGNTDVAKWGLLVDAASAAASQAAAAGSATASAASATTSTEQAVISTAQAVISTAQAVISTTKAGEASTSAATASTQAGVATTQAGIATAQAVLAAASAAEAAATADSVDHTLDDAVGLIIALG
jgi:hypothetical protein